jgi:dTMP kinase
MNKFITLEGGEGSGKSTQAKLLFDYLKRHNINAILTREPGGSPGAELIRELLITGPIDRWSVTSEVLLLYAARVDHWQKIIQPSLESGKWVICDRFIDSTIAYQGYGKGIDIEFLQYVYKKVVGDFYPDCTFIFDIPAKIGLERAKKRMLETNTTTQERFESMGLEFHERVHKGFIEVAQKNQNRCKIIDAQKTPQDIHQEIIDYLQPKNDI